MNKRISTDSGWARDADGDSTGDWEVTVLLDGQPMGTFLAYPAYSFASDIGPNIRVALNDELQQLEKCEQEEEWVNWVFTSNGPAGHTSFPCASNEEATRAVTILNNIIGLLK